MTSTSFWELTEAPPWGTETSTLKYYFEGGTNTLTTKYGTVTLTFDKDGNCTYTYTTDGAKLPDHLTEARCPIRSSSTCVTHTARWLSRRLPSPSTAPTTGPEVVPGEHAPNVVEDVTVSQEGNLNDIIKDDEGLNNLHFSINGKGTVVEGEVRYAAHRSGYRKVYLHPEQCRPGSAGPRRQSSIKETFTITADG